MFARIARRLSLMRIRSPHAGLEKGLDLSVPAFHGRRRRSRLVTADSTVLG